MRVDVTSKPLTFLTDTAKLKEAFHLVANSKMLHLLTENFIREIYHSLWYEWCTDWSSDDLRKQFYLVRREIHAFMQEYDVKIPSILALLQY